VLVFGAALLAGCGGAPSTPRSSPTTTVETAPPTPTGEASSAPSASATGGPAVTSPSGPAYSFAVSLSGADAVQGSAGAPAAGGCGTPTGFSATVGGAQVRFEINNRSAPAGQPVQLSPGDIVVQVGADVWNVGSSSNAPHGTTGTLVHDTDGSGAATFMDLYLAADPMRTPQESGSIRWTCR
jgi:hypothetical protein